jgi:CspA family cold shock protein
MRVVFELAVFSLLLTMLRAGILRGCPSLLLDQWVLWNGNAATFARECTSGKRYELFFGNRQMAEGTIKRITDKGFGFIDNGTDKDLFFHSSSVEGATFDELREGQRVTFNEARGQKGPCAEQVTPA